MKISISDLRKVFVKPNKFCKKFLIVQRSNRLWPFEGFSDNHNGMSQISTYMEVLRRLAKEPEGNRLAAAELELASTVLALME